MAVYVVFMLPTSILKVSLGCDIKIHRDITSPTAAIIYNQTLDCINSFYNLHYGGVKSLTGCVYIPLEQMSLPTELINRIQVNWPDGLASLSAWLITAPFKPARQQLSSSSVLPLTLLDLSGCGRLRLHDSRLLAAG